jgi:hypothetical protein
VKGHFDATGEISCGKPVYRKRDGDYLLHYWDPSEEWIISGGADFRDKTGVQQVQHCGGSEKISLVLACPNKVVSGRGWGVLENSAHINAALSMSEWQVVPGSKQTMCVEAFAYAL